MLPSMVGGKQLEEEEAIRLAERRGLRNYPSFATHDKAAQWIEQNHGSQDPEANAPMQGWYSRERGQTMPKGVGYPPKMSPEAKRVQQQMQRDMQQAIARAFGSSMPGGVPEAGREAARRSQSISEASNELGVLSDQEQRQMQQPTVQASRQPSSRMQEVLQMAFGQTDAAIEAERRRRRRQQILNDAMGIISTAEMGRMGGY